MPSRVSPRPMTPPSGSKEKDDVRAEAQALARDMARDMLEFTRVAWKLTSQVGKMALRAAEDLADEAEKGWERQRAGRSREK